MMYKVLTTLAIFCIAFVFMGFGCAVAAWDFWHFDDLHLHWSYMHWLRIWGANAFLIFIATGLFEWFDSYRKSRKSRKSRIAE